ncbi:MAG: hypothetical protein WC855_01135 [Thermodesulfovibrionales bacterium]
MLSSKSKRYLSGSDWVINTLDYMMKTTTCAGNMLQIVLALDSAIDETALRVRLNRFIKEFPVLHGNVTRDYKLTPYWKIPGKIAADANLNVHHAESLGSCEDVLSLLGQSVNTPFKNDNEHLAFHLIEGKQGSFFAMTFDHRLFDARGAEAFLGLFQRYLAEDDFSVSGDICFTSSSALTGWMKKLYAGRNVNRKIIALSKSTPETLSLSSGEKKSFRYRLVSFDADETERIYDNAYNEAGYLMEMPYLLSVVIQTVHELFRSRARTTSSYLIPVSIDMRPGKDAIQELFFNHVSYLFFQAQANGTDNLKGLINSVKQQMYEQVKADFPADLAEASLLTRIAPLPVLGKLLHLPLKGKMATFVFSYLGKNSQQPPEFMGIGIKNIFHMPRVPVPPGLGFFCNYFNGQLNLVISYLEGLVQNEEINMLEAGLRKRFGAGQG